MFDVSQVFSCETLSATDKFKILLVAANTLLALSFSVLLITIVVCYPLADLFSFPMQLAGHITMMLSATVMKVSYVGRCIAQYELHREVR